MNFVWKSLLLSIVLTVLLNLALHIWRRRR